MELRLDTKVALITGGSRGIGLEIAKTFVRAGAKVMIVSRKANALRAATAQVQAETSYEEGNTSSSSTPRCDWFEANTGDPESANKAIAATLKQFGTLDILVNNAATNPYAGPMIDADLGRWNKTIQVNLTAPLMWSQEAWRATMRANGGVIINISSVGAKMTSGSLGVYDMTKASLLHMTQQLGAELGPGVRVNAICPGLIKTDFARVLWEGDRGEAVASSYPLRRLGETTDIANAALYLASDASSWMTGQDLTLDGGGLVSFAEKKPLPPAKNT